MRKTWNSPFTWNSEWPWMHLCAYAYVHITTGINTVFWVPDDTKNTFCQKQSISRKNKINSEQASHVTTSPTQETHNSLHLNRNVVSSHFHSLHSLICTKTKGCLNYVIRSQKTFKKELCQDNQHQHMLRNICSRGYAILKIFIKTDKMMPNITIKQIIKSQLTFNLYSSTGDSTVISTAAWQQKGLGIFLGQRTFLCAVCRFYTCLCGFWPDTLASSYMWEWANWLL